MSTITSIRTQYHETLIGVDADPVRLSWQIQAATGSEQSQAELHASNDPLFVSGVQSTTLRGATQVAVLAPGGDFTSREIRHYRVRALVDDEWTAWSNHCTVEIGLLRPDDWQAIPIGLADDPGATEMSPSPMLRKGFALDRPVQSARLFTTSHGMHEMYLNGQRVGSDLFAPGWSTYNKRLITCTYDVTDQLRAGQNVLGGVLGDGWFRGRLGWERGNSRCRYGTELALLAQLEVRYVDGDVETIATNQSWSASTGAIRKADMYDGCEIDLNRSQPGWVDVGFDDASWSPARVGQMKMDVLEPWITAPIRPFRSLDVDLSIGPDGSTRVDVGQNISGYLSIVVKGKPQQDVVTRHAEIVEPNGSLHLRALRSAIASDRFILDGDNETTLEPSFTFHGFRYADIVTDAEIVSVRAIAISSDLQERGTFSCSHQGLNTLESNVRWSQRDNFVGVPTDCPQRDERLGWTGDAQAFAATANTLLDCRQFWLSWLRDLSLDQDGDGVPSVVPHVVLEGEASRGRAGWADAATIVPWASYEAYGDEAVLEQQLDSMIRWVATLSDHRLDDGLLGGEFQFGDWLDPDAPGDEPWKAKADGDYVANAFFSFTARLTGRAAQHLGVHDVATAMFELATEIAELTWRRWSEHAVTSQTGCAIAIELEIAPIDLHPGISTILATLVLQAEGAVSTGFLGTPLVLPALSRFGNLGAAYLMLLRTDIRSWLYQVANGATTVWERWDAILPDGSIHHGTMKDIEATGAPQTPDPDVDLHEPHMLSFNHYAYGAVIDWMYRNVGGVSPDPDLPAYQRVVFAPKPCTAITSASTSIAAALGTVSLDWRLEAGVFLADVVLPFGSLATFEAPASDRSLVLVNGEQRSGTLDLGHGAHRIEVSNPTIWKPGVT